MIIEISDFEGVVSPDLISRFVHSIHPKPKYLKINYPSGFVQKIDLDAFILPEYHLTHEIPIVVSKGETLTIEVK